MAWLIDLTSQIAGDHVEGDELVAAGDDVAIVRGELHCKDGKLVAFKTVLKRTPRRVHAVVGWHQSVLLDPFCVALSQQVPGEARTPMVIEASPDVVAVLNLWQQPANQLC